MRNIKNTKNILILVLVIFCSFVYSDIKKLKVVATTTHIGNIINEIGKEKVEVVTIVSANMCPGHFDIEPGMIKKVLDSKILLYHGWEKWVNKIVEINPSIDLIKIDVNNNWLLPGINLQATYEICKQLCEIDSRNKYFYEQNYKNYKEEIENFVSKIEKTKYNKIKVLCADRNSEFLRWLGFEIVYVYKTSEEISLKEIKNIIKLARERKVNLIVDNLQSGFKLGRQVAKDVKAKYLVLTNFPIEDSYIKTLQHILKQIDTTVYE